MRYAYPFTVAPDEDGRLVVAFPDVKGASTDGVDENRGDRDSVTRRAGIRGYRGGTARFEL